jgi:hypothetical protein
VRERRTCCSGLILVAVFLVSLAPGPARADDKLHDRFSDEQLITVLNDAGFAAVTIVEESFLKISVNGESFALLNRGDGDLLLYYGLKGYTLGCDTTNAWNQNARLTRAYIDDEGDPILESDLLSDAGLSSGHVRHFVRIFVQAAGEYRKFLNEADG